ncbi:MAG TPA: SGNH/GDSL hydrolase family protein [Deltaproteobacteria bacterium]|nr:SGNH/GDSL hydrolase family protein [Deltaproteobacteria bacterium]
MKNPRDILVNAAILCASLLVFFIAAETVTRLVISRSAPNREVSMKRIFVPLDGPRVYGLRPGASFLGYRINSLGLRDDEVSVEKPAGTVRIISLGDSIAFGQGVKDKDDVVSEVIEALAPRRLGRPVEVVNAGVPGYNTAQELAYLEERLLKLDPDLVILHVCLNDADPVELEHETQTLFTPPSDLEGYNLNIRTLVNMSYFLRLVKAKLLALSPSLRNRAVNMRVGEAAWSAMKERMARMKQLLDGRGVGLLVLIYPWQVQLEVDRAAVEPQKDLGRFLEEAGIEYIDLYDRFKAAAAEGAPLFFEDGVHPTEKGHAIAARAALEAVVSGLGP